jgi:hypothetical protein
MENVPSVPVATGWAVSGVDAATAREVSRHDGSAAYGGTPSDRSVLEAIAAIKARGWKVTLYPFVMMDVPTDNELPDPYGGERQAAYPWRGRITCFPGPLQAASADASSAARAQADAFCGGAQAADFTLVGETVAFSGDPDDWGYRRMVLHYAKLVEAAGGIDALMIGSELRGLTSLRGEEDSFPFVEQLVTLAADVRTMVGPATKLTYGADWSEYFGHQPADGSGDVFFHLDPLWASPAIDAVGIDNYMPLSDWRDEDFAAGNPDGFASPYDRKALGNAIGSGEGFDWFYASQADRRDRQRTPIEDGLAGNHWVFRYKDIRGWWENPHHNRNGGVEQAAATDWVPRSKPVWLTELGCPAVDKGPNQPNVFPDAKSSENALPHFSDGGRSDLAQRRLLEAHLDYWGADDPQTNPVSDVYGGRMVDAGRVYAWAWDVRPFPAFPLNRGEWADGDNWLYGHWLNGRVGAPSISDLTKAILEDHGVMDADTSGADGIMAGYVVTEPGSAREALAPLIEMFDLVATEADGKLRLAAAGSMAGAAIVIDDPVAAQSGQAGIESLREPDQSLPSEVTIRFLDPMSDYQAGTARAFDASAAATVAAGFDVPAAIEAGQADALALDWLRRARTGRETVRFAVAGAERRPQPGSIIKLPAKDDGHYLVTAIEDGLFRSIEARRLFRRPPVPDRAGLPGNTSAAAAQTGRPFALFLDLPVIGGAPPQDCFRVAAFAQPWRTQIVLASPSASGFVERASLVQPAVTGRVVEASGQGIEGRIDRAGWIDVRLDSGELSSVSFLQMLNGANAAAMRAANGVWEMLQFAGAEEISPSVWRLTHLLRGQLGTGDAMLAGTPADADFVLLDEAVAPAGLTAAEIGLLLNWKVGPAGYELTDRYFAAFQHSGAMRARLPLSPVHLRASSTGGGSIELRWIRRSRIDADSWHGVDVPLGEEAERYAVQANAPGQPAAILAETAEPRWICDAAQLASAFSGWPEKIEFTVRQISTAAGPGLPATLLFDPNN